MYSMTGYGRCENIENNLDIIVEIKSVNHRYFEFSSRIPKLYGYIETPLKNLIKSKINRGKIEVSVYITHPDGKPASVSINKELVKEYVNSLRKCGIEFGLEDDISLTSLLRIPDVFNVQEIKDAEQEMISTVLGTASSALASFLEMREKEGENLKADILSRLCYIEKLTEYIEEKSPETTQNYFNKLHERLSELLEDKNIDEQRLVTEAAIFSEKTAVDEETVRLHSHISQMRELAELNEPIGKKLDFIVQEMNREVNTIGSKAAGVDITKTVVDLKSEIEKIREQIQNVE